MEEKLKWKGKDQRCCVFISMEDKVYQVALNKDQQASLVFILPQLFDDHVIKILPDEVPLTIPKAK